MSRSIAISCITVLAVGALALTSFQSSSAPEFAPEVQSGRVVTFLGNDFSTRQLLVQSRRGDLVATTPITAEINADAERLVLGSLRRSVDLFEFTDFADWKVKADHARNEQRAQIQRGEGWITNGNGPSEEARKLISESRILIEMLDRLEETTAQGIEAMSHSIADGYKTSPLWINLRSVAGYRVN